LWPPLFILAWMDAALLNGSASDDSRNDLIARANLYVLFVVVAFQPLRIARNPYSRRERSVDCSFDVLADNSDVFKPPRTASA
jgi:hypothetical protein